MDINSGIPIYSYICEENIRKCIMSTEKQPVYIRSLTLNDYKCFKGKNKFFFCKNDSGKKLSQCTVILGDNGTGKTNLLKAIANLEPVLDDVKNVDSSVEKVEDFYCDIAVLLGDRMLSPDLSKKPMYKPRVVERYDCEIQYDIECDFLKIKKRQDNINKSTFEEITRYTTRFPMPGNSQLHESTSPTKYGYTQKTNYVDPTEDISRVRIDAYGTNRHSKFGSKRLENLLNSESLFYDDNRLIDIESWILQLDTAKHHKRPGASARYLKVRNLIRHSSLFPNVKDIEIGFDDNENSFVYFITEDGRYRLSDLGYGYQCTFSWIFDFCKKLFDRYPKSKNPFHEPAILLVDEIDMHLHPTWQRSILSELCKMFPMTQFIVTTHSPLLVQSIEKINLYALVKDNDTIKVSYYPETSFQGWTVEEIMCELMYLGENIRPERYRELKMDFEKAMNSGDLEKGKKAYDELKKILHPQNVENDLLDIDLGQLKALQDD